MYILVVMNRFSISFFLILTVLAVYSLYRTYSDVQMKAQTIDDLASSVKQLKENNMHVKQDIAEKKTRDFIEYQAVSKLGLAKKNQEVLIIPGNKDNVKKNSVEEIDDKNKAPFKQWKDLFLKNNPFRY